MAWTDIFPVMTEDLLDEFRMEATAAEREELEGWLGMKRIFRPVRSHGTRSQGRRHVVSATLFWKMVLGSDPDLPTPTRERLVMAKRLGLVKRFAPWSSYIEPLLDHSAGAVARHPDVEFRLYLARDLDFLVEDFIRLGWTVYLMKSPPCGIARADSGASWRWGTGTRW